MLAGLMLAAFTASNAANESPLVPIPQGGGGITVTLPTADFDTSVPAGTVILQPVVTTPIDPALNYIGFQGDFLFDSTVVSFASPVVAAAGLTAGTWTVAGNVLNTGPGTFRTLRVSAFVNDGVTPLDGSGTLYNLRMLRVSSTPGTSTSLAWRLDPDNFYFIDTDLAAHPVTQTDGLITITGPGPTATATPVPTATATPVPTATATPVPTATATPVPTATATPRPTATATPVPTATATPVPTATATPVPTATATPVPTATATPVPTATATPSPTATATPRPTATATPGPTATATPRPTATATPRPTATATPRPTATATPRPTATATPAPTPTPRATATPTATPGGSVTPTPTGTPVVTPTPTFDGYFVIGDLNAVVGNHVTFWSSQWAQLNSLSGGPAPNSFKGFARETDPDPAACGGTWTTTPGNSSHPPNHVPRFITAIASSSITKTGNIIRGNIPILVIIETDHHHDRGDEAVNSGGGGGGHHKTGTVVAIVCSTTPPPTPTPGGSPTPTPTGTPVVTPTPTFDGNFVIGDLNAVVGNQVTFWSLHWAERNSLSGGSAPHSFKGFARHTNPDPAACGGTWTSNLLSSAFPPRHIPRFITAIAASSVTRSGWTFTGNIPMLVVIETDDDDGHEEDVPVDTDGDGEPDAGGFHPKTGTVIAVFCATDPLRSATLTNISTRLRVETGDNVLIGGFVVTGTDAKKLLLRATGPSLPFPDHLADPILELRDSSGQTIATNDNWMDAPNAQAIIDTTIAPGNNLEPAILMNLAPGGYTAMVRGANNESGTALVEAYDLDRTVNSKLANISTRGFVQTGDNTLIGGMTVLGHDPLRVIVRAVGPSLSLPGALSDPMLELRDSDGVLIASNDNWRTDQEAEITTTGMTPSSESESAIVRELVPGQYTTIVRGVNGATGIALVEVYGLQ